MAEQSEFLKPTTDQDASEISSSVMDTSVFNQEREENKSWTDV